MVRVYHRFTEGLDDGDVGAMLGVLSSAERTRFARFVHWVDRRDFAAAHSLLRHALSDNGGIRPQDWSFEVNGFGKPSLSRAVAARAPLAFNLSHTRGLAACAVTTAPAIGLDVERVDRGGDEIAASCFSSVDLAALDAVPRGLRTTRFIELWTLKEAYIKALGLGLSHPLKSFGFSFDGAASLRFRADQGDGVDWQFLLFAPAAQYRMAAAVPGRGGIFPETFEQRDRFTPVTCQVLRSNLIA